MTFPVLLRLEELLSRRLASAYLQLKALHTRPRPSKVAFVSPTILSYSNRPSSTQQVVVLRDGLNEPFSTSQFQPPSSSCATNNLSTMPVQPHPRQGCLPNTPSMATVRPLRHSSTSPLKEPLPGVLPPAVRPRQLRRLDQTQGPPGSTPMSRRRHKVGREAKNMDG